MENEQHHYELRSGSRSRSHTPMVPNRPIQQLEVTEHHYDLRNKSRERSHTPGEATSSRRSGSRSLTGSSSKTYEKSMETIQENKEELIMESLIDNQSTKSDSSGTPGKVERRLEHQKAKKQIFEEDKTEKEIKEIQDSLGSSRSAYKIYKQSGDWWNVFPKTDYTYSRSSLCRYEIAPGILAMPNMSRRSIHSDDGESNSQASHKCYSWILRSTTEKGYRDSVDTVDLKETSSFFRSPEDMSRTSDSAVKLSVHKKTYPEQYTSRKEVIPLDSGNFSNIRKRFLPYWATDLASKSSDNISQYDSDSEMNKDFITTSSTDHRWRLLKWFSYFTTLLVVWSKTAIKVFKFRTDERQYYSAQVYHSYHESKWNVLRKSLDRYLQYTYFFFVRILVFDTWLLSRFTSVRKWLQERNVKIFWITLLPLFFLSGAYIAQDHYFTCVDFLRDVQYSVTDTTYHVFDDITTKMTSFNYELLAGYIANLKKYSVDIFTSNLNVSLPEIPPIGWNITW